MTTLQTLDEFIEQRVVEFGLSREEESSFVPLYLIFRDLTVKNFLKDISLVSGEKWGITGLVNFVVTGVNVKSGALQVYIPIDYEGEIDLLWLKDVTEKCLHTSQPLPLHASPSPPILQDISSSAITPSVVATAVHTTHTEGATNTGSNDGSSADRMVNPPIHISSSSSSSGNSSKSKSANANTIELYLCIYTMESIIYQRVIDELP